MILCDDGHEEICYEVGHCPLCRAEESIRKLESDLEDSRVELQDAEAEIQKLEDEILNLKERTAS